MSAAVGVPIGVGGWVGANVGVLVGVGVSVAVRSIGGTVGSSVALGSELSHPTAVTIRRTNNPPIMPRVEAPIRCLSANLLPIPHL